MVTNTRRAYERITAGPPEVTGDQAREILRMHFGRDAVSIRRLVGETEHNLHITDGEGTEYVLRVARPEERQALECQNALLQHIAERDPGLPVPRVVAAVDGERCIPVRVGQSRLLARLLTWLPGTPLAEVRHLSAELLADLGSVAGRLTSVTAEFGYPSTQPHYWELTNSADVLAECLPYVTDPSLREAIGASQEWLQANAERLKGLPKAVVHQDVNAFNVLVTRSNLKTRVSGVIDFGDTLRTARVADLAVLLAGVLRVSDRPLAAVTEVARTYYAACALSNDELDLVFPLAVARLAAVAATAARLSADAAPGDPRHRSAGMATKVAGLMRIPTAVGTAAIRRACGLPAHPRSRTVIGWLAEHAEGLAQIVAGDLVALDLTAGSEIFDGCDPLDPHMLQAAASSRVVALQPAVAVGRFGEPRFLSPRRRTTGPEESDNVHIGLDLFVKAGATVHAPVDGVVQQVSAADIDVVLRHDPAPGATFYTLYRGLDAQVAAGDSVSAGEQIGTVRAPGVDPAMPPRVTVQLAVESVAEWASVPDQVTNSEFGVFAGLFPDATALLDPRHGITAWVPAIEHRLAGRARYLPGNHPTYFAKPINMARARGTWFFDEQGRSYLDSLNNVTLLGHCHPRLTAAVTRQIGRLNTNSRFVYDLLDRYAERLTATLPRGLDVVYFVNSGSEANDLALRMARYVTGRQDLVIIDDAYHGNTALVTEITPARYKLTGKPKTTHSAPAPDCYRGTYGYDDPDAGAKYAAHVIDTFDRLAGEGSPPAAFVFEALLASGGQVVLPPGYLPPIFAAARQRGVLTIADEVQVGFGRLGEAFWGFQTQGELVPDMVTLGKSMGNGFPVAALVTTREISQAFEDTGRFFSTYGGNPVACAVGLEVLDVLAEEGLQHNALVVGQYFRDRLTMLGDRHELIGDVRGQGFYSGVEFVRERVSKEAAREETLKICEGLKDEGVLAYPTGPQWNVLKLKPPLTFTRDQADLFVAMLDRVLERGF